MVWKTTKQFWFINIIYLKTDNALDMAVYTQSFMPFIYLMGFLIGWFRAGQPEVAFLIHGSNF